MRKLVLYSTLVCFVWTQSAVRAGPLDEGMAAGAAANTASQGFVSEPSASSVVPGYTATAPQGAYYGQPNLNAQGNAQLAACALTPNDPVCQAQVGAVNSANTPRSAVGFYDPSVVAARSIAGNPAGTLGDMSSYYAACITTPGTAPAATENRLCERYVGIGNYFCSRDLNVQVTVRPTCEPGSSAAVGQANRNGVDYMVARAVCEPFNGGANQKFAVYAAGSLGACVGWQGFDLPTAPPTTSWQLVANLAPHWSGACQALQVAAAPGSGCTGSSCSYTFVFGSLDYGCAPGQVTGDQLATDSGQPLSSAECFAWSTPPAGGGCPGGGTLLWWSDLSGQVCATDAGPWIVVGAGGWTIPLSYTKPGMTYDTTDAWDDKCALLTSGERCSVVTGDVCTDGPSTKRIEGVDITRPCWSYGETLTCQGGEPLDQCASLVASGCTAAGSACKQANATTGVCQIYEDTYQCPVGSQTTASVSGCPANIACVGSNCFNTSSPNDADFARVVTMMEAAREAGVYMDPNSLRVFKGEDDRCRERLLVNCCSPNGQGAGMSNAQMFATGSRYMYDVLFNGSADQSFVTQGLSALLSSAGEGSTFSAYGVTVGTGSASVPAGAVTLVDTPDFFIAFDPTTLVIAIVIQVVITALTSCTQQEAIVDMKEGANLCHKVGTYCSSSLPLLGCVETTDTFCCFNSKLARILNEQGRPQLGRGWGSAQGPDCSGFSVYELQKLDFAAMDLSEFYASIVVTPPDVTGMQSGAVAKMPSCYYGQGKC